MEGPNSFREKTRNINDQRQHGSDSETDKTNVSFSSTVEPKSENELDLRTINTIGKTNGDFIENETDSFMPNRRQSRIKLCKTGLTLVLFCIIINGVIVWICTSHYCSHKGFTMTSPKPILPVTDKTSTLKKEATMEPLVDNTQCFVEADLDVSKLNKSNHLLYWKIKNEKCVDYTGSNFKITQNGTYDIYTRLNLVPSSVTVNYQHALEVKRWNGEWDILDLTKQGSSCNMHCHSGLEKRSVWLQKDDDIRVTMINQGIVKTSMSTDTSSYFELRKNN